MLTSCAIDAFLYGIFLILSIEFRIIGQNIKNAINAKELESIREIVVRHQELIEIDEEIKNTFSPIFFYAFFLGSIAIASSIFLISTATSTTNLLALLFHTFTTFSLVFMYCTFEEKLITESEGIAAKIYESNWHEIEDIGAKKSIQLVLMRSQKACTLAGYGFVTLSIDTFALVSTSNTN
ncbi:hypothetical protein ACKWTF_000610 [Chironomus riparius]